MPDPFSTPPTCGTCSERLLVVGYTSAISRPKMGIEPGVALSLVICPSCDQLAKWPREAPTR